MAKNNILCPNKDLCGSCSLSETPYKQQLKDKLTQINTAAKESGLASVCNDIKESPVTSHYRNRMDFVIDYRGKFGLREKGKWWKVIDNHTCFIPDESIIELFNILYPWVKNSGVSYFDRKSYEGLLRYAVIRVSKIGQKMVIVVTSEPKDALENSNLQKSLNELKDLLDVDSFIWASTTSKSDVSLGEKIQVIKGKEYIEEKINGYNFRIRPQSFFQTNSFAAEVLQNTLISIAKELISKVKHNKSAKDLKILDLYCGSGFFTLPLGNLSENVIGVENSVQAIEDAKENAVANKSRVEFICEDVEKFSINRHHPDLILVDPPRAGLHRSVIKDILDAKPKSIIYVSCKYQKFFEEMELLGTHYKIEKAIAVDMFPHTNHVELISALTLKD